jgi:hypothetical protein
MMAIKDWTTQFPTNLDTNTQQPDLVNNEDLTRVSHVMAIRNALQEVEGIVGSDNLESSSLRKRVADLENSSGSPSVEEDITYYVDGYNGNDSNDGLTWETAKQTFAFLYSGSSSAIPRHVNAAITINVRNNVYQHATDKNLYLDKFYGSGSITITGEFTTEVSNITPTGWINTLSNPLYRTYVDASAASWTTDAFEGMFIRRVGLTAVYPIISNTATRLETVDAAITNEAHYFDILSVPKLVNALLSDPETPISNYSNRLIGLNDISIPITIEGLNAILPNMEFGTGFYGMLLYDIIEFHNCVFDSVYLERNFNSVRFLDCLLKDKKDNYSTPVTILWAAGPVFFDDTAIVCNTETGGFSSGIYIGQGTTSFIRMDDCRIEGADFGFYSELGFTILGLTTTCLFNNCETAISLENTQLNIGVYDSTGYFHFRNCTNGIILNSGKVVKESGTTLLGTSTTNEIVISTNPLLVKTFTQANAEERIYNASTGGTFVYVDPVTLDYFSNSDYNNSSSGLDAYTIQDAIDELAATTQYFEEGFEPNGFPEISETTVSFDNSLMRLTIAPTSSSFSYYCEGVKHTKSSSETVDITDTEGLWYFYYSGTNLIATQIFSTDILRKFAFVAVLYWDSVNNKQIYLGNERHGFIMDGMTHLHFHDVLGTQFISGLALSGIVADGDGSSDTHAQLGFDGGIIRDEDIQFNISGVSTPAQIPVFYKNGVSGDWRRQDANNFPVIRFGTGRLAYNQWTGSTWQQTQVVEGDAVLIHFFATNDTSQPVIAIQGQNTYTDIPLARIGSASEIANLVIDGLPFIEFVPLGTVIYQTSSAYTNTVKARVRTTDEGASYVDFREKDFPKVGSASEHGNLSGLLDDDHTQYALINGTRDFTGAIGGVSPVATTDFTTKAYVDGLAGTLAENTDVDMGVEVVDSFADTLGKAAFWDYVIYSNSGVNMRAGRMMSVWDASTDVIEYNEVATDDLGNTSDIVLSIDINSNNVRFISTASSDNWTIKVKRSII